MPPKKHMALKGAAAAAAAEPPNKHPAHPKRGAAAAKTFAPDPNISNALDPVTLVAMFNSLSTRVVEINADTAAKLANFDVNFQVNTHHLDDLFAIMQQIQQALPEKRHPSTILDNSPGLYQSGTVQPHSCNLHSFCKTFSLLGMGLPSPRWKTLQTVPLISTNSQSCIAIKPYGIDTFKRTSKVSSNPWTVVNLIYSMHAQSSKTHSLNLTPSFSHGSFTYRSKVPTIIGGKYWHDADFTYKLPIFEAIFLNHQL